MAATGPPRWGSRQAQLSGAACDGQTAVSADGRLSPADASAEGTRSSEGRAGEPL